MKWPNTTPAANANAGLEHSKGNPVARQKSRRGFNPYTAWWEVAAAQNAALFTIQMRVMGLAAARSPREAVMDPETQLMVTEKAAALVKGGMAAALVAPMAMLRVGLGFSQGRPERAFEALAEMPVAFVKPAFHTVRANERRLRGRALRR